MDEKGAGTWVDEIPVGGLHCELWGDFVSFLFFFFLFRGALFVTFGVEIIIACQGGRDIYWMDVAAIRNKLFFFFRSILMIVIFVVG